MAAAILLPPQLVALVVIAQHLPEWLKERYAWYIQTFNIANIGLSAIAAGQAPAGSQTVEWRHYGRDLAHTRYAPIDQITAANFNTLEVAWRFKTDSLGPRPEFNFQATPLMANGMLYFTAGSRRARGSLFSIWTSTSSRPSTTTTATRRRTP